MSRSYHNKSRFVTKHRWTVGMTKNYRQKEAQQFRSWLRSEDQRAINEQLSDTDIRYPQGRRKPENAMRMY
jgi:hypothetical protein